MNEFITITQAMQRQFVEAMKKGRRNSKKNKLAVERSHWKYNKK